MSKSERGVYRQQSCLDWHGREADDGRAGVYDLGGGVGRWYQWGTLVTLIAAALMSDERHGRGIGQWVHEHTDELRRRLGLEVRADVCPL
jgi:hypothetical protein